MCADYVNIGVGGVHVDNCRSRGDHNDSDWLSVAVSTADGVQQSHTALLGDNVHAGDQIPGVLVGPFAVDDRDLAIAFLVTNLRDSDDELGAATKTGIAVAGSLLEFAGAAEATHFLGFDASKLAAGFEAAAGFVLKQLGFHSSDPDCRGPVASHGEVLKGAERHQLHHYGPMPETTTSPSQCGNDPHSVITYLIVPAQDGWRFCTGCRSLFFATSDDASGCPAGGGHRADGWMFVLPHDSGVDQSSWRYCTLCHALFFDGYEAKGHCASGGAEHQAAGFDFSLRHDRAGEGQSSWRYCGKCQVLFFDGDQDKGVCAAPAPSTHEAAGYNYALAHDTGADQSDWRYCRKCQGLFFDGYPTKGACPAGGAHAAAGYNYALAHDTGLDQSDWRYCPKCQGLFFDGYPTKGACPAGGGHAAAGYNFALSHDTGADQSDWRYCAKCQGLFFDGYPTKGACPVPVPSAHVASGYDFALDHA